MISYTIFSMQKLRVHPAFIHYLAIIAILMGSVAPLVSQVIAAHRTNDTSFYANGFVCSLSSAFNAGENQANNQSEKSAWNWSEKWSGNHPGNDSKTFMNDQCAYCTLQGSYLPPTQFIVAFIRLDLVQQLPKLYYQSPSPLFAWIKLPSRAPPRLV